MIGLFSTEDIKAHVIKHTKRWSTSFIREIQIKPTEDITSYSLGWLEFFFKWKINVGENLEKLEPLKIEKLL